MKLECTLMGIYGLIVFSVYWTQFPMQLIKKENACPTQLDVAFNCTQLKYKYHNLNFYGCTNYTKTYHIDLLCENTTQLPSCQVLQSTCIEYRDQTISEFIWYIFILTMLGIGFCLFVYGIMDNLSPPDDF